MDKVKNSLFSWTGYVGFFVMSLFISTCSLLVFLEGTTVDYEILNTRTIHLIVNLLFLSLLFTIFDGLRRKFYFEKPIRKILKATEIIMHGDFSVRIEPRGNIVKENEFDIIIENFNRMSEELSNVETMRSDFISNVSHEFKTPLAIIQNKVTLIQSEFISDTEKEKELKAIQNTCTDFSNLITNILKLNKLENQNIYPDVKRYNLTEQIYECLLNFENQLEEKNISVTNDLEDDVFLYCDRELMLLVWNNLFSNSVKFTKENGNIKIKLIRDRDGIVVEISDDGIGMSEETGSRIFEKFYQGDTSHITKGNGLGLSLVKRVIEIVGGDVYVTSKIGIGTTFYVKLGSDVHPSNKCEAFMTRDG